MILGTTNVIEKIDEIPVPDIYRKRTDNICTLFAALFSLSLFVYCCMAWNTANVYKTNFPSDSDGNVCGVDYPGHPFVYFSDLKDMTQRLCVSTCPSLQDSKLKCIPTSRIGCFRRPPLSPSAFRMYDTESSKCKVAGKVARIGHLCMPRDGKVRQQLLMRSGLYQRLGFIDSYDIILLCLLIAVTVGTVYMVLVQMFPTVMHYAGIVLGGLGSIGLGAMLLLYHSHYFQNMRALRLVLAILLIIGGGFTLILTLCYRRYLRVSTVFLSYSTRFVTQNSSVLLYILLLLLFTTGLVALTVFELLAVWSASDPAFLKDRVFYVSQGKHAFTLSILILIQLYWGLAFLKELFNFCISGNAINWYFGKNNACWSSFLRVIRFHFGSVVGGAFMVGFFSLGDFFFDLIKPDNYMGLYGRCYYPICGWLTSLFELVRSDSMAYINLTGLAYCNSSRYCEFLCNNTRLYNGSQPVSRVKLFVMQFYRIGAHLLLVSLIGLFPLWYRPNISLLAEIFIIIIAFYIVTFFVDVHADAAEGLSITFLTEEYLEIGDYGQVKRAPPQLVNELLIASNIAYPE